MNGGGFHSRDDLHYTNEWVSLVEYSMCLLKQPLPSQLELADALMIDVSLLRLLNCKGFPWMEHAMQS